MRTARTKIIATLGPASSNDATLSRMLDAGVDVCRLNFSHGDLAAHGRTLALVRALAQRRGQPVAVLGDLCGPKIRLGVFEAPDGATVAAGQSLPIVRGAGPCTAHQLTVSYQEFVDEVDIGHRIYIDDGLVRLIVRERSDDELLCEVLVGGALRSRKGVNLPDTRLNTPALTEKDRTDAAWAIAQGVDFLALSFVRQPDDLYELRRFIKDAGGDTPVIIKVEKTEALQHIDELIENSDGVLVARGDLGVETDVWRVPLIQKEIIDRCVRVGVPVIVATQMLQSMVDSPMPTRAEVSDVANAVFDRADAVMLSGETAAGKYPVESVEMMSRVAAAAGEYVSGAPAIGAARGARPRRNRCGDDVYDLAVHFHPQAAVAHAAVRAALDLRVHLVAVWTASGATVRQVARHRLPMPVLGLAADERVLRRMTLLFGVTPVQAEPMENPAAMAGALDRVLLRAGHAAAGDLIVVVTSTHPTISGETNTVLVHRVGADRLRPVVQWPSI